MMNGAHPAGGSPGAAGGQGVPRYRDVPMGGSLAARFETRANGSRVATSTEPLQPCATRPTDRLLHRAEATPDQTLVAERVDAGDWRRVSDAEALASARSIARSIAQAIAQALLAGVPFAAGGAAFAKAMPPALKKAKPDTKEFRATLKAALETIGRTPVSQGVLNFTATDPFGCQPETGVLLTIAGGDWKLAPTQ